MKRREKTRSEKIKATNKRAVNRQMRDQREAENERIALAKMLRWA